MKTFRMGRIRPRFSSPPLTFGTYVDKSILPTPPLECDYTLKAVKWLDQMLANDELGDCTAAGAFHIAGSWLANNGKPITFTKEDAIKFYSLTTGYVPGKPETDNGGDEVTVMNYWAENGLGTKPPHKMSAWVAVDGGDIDLVRAAIWLFGNIYIGASLPDSAVNPFPQESGFVWSDTSGAPSDANGHCWCALGYDAKKNLQISTWGMRGAMTPEFLAKYGTPRFHGETYAILSADWVNDATAKAPSGFDIGQLQSDLLAFGN